MNLSTLFMLAVSYLLVDRICMGIRMSKKEFMEELRRRLSNLPRSEAEKSIGYYEEMIDDRMEDGMPEAEAVKALGNIEDIVSDIMYDMSIPVLAKTKIKRSKEKASNKGLWFTLAIVGSPIWVPLFIAFAAVIFALYVVVWSLIVSLYAVVISFGVAAVAGFFCAIALVFVRSFPVGVFGIGVAFVCGSLCMFTLKPVVLMTKGLIQLTKTMMHGIKSLFINRRGNGYENE